MYSNLSAIVLSLENPDKSGQYSRIIGYQRGAFTSAHMYVGWLNLTPATLSTPKEGVQPLDKY